jgi:methylmalonyl-CoA/ethylmalonyl-CoA epimerase
MTDQPRAIAGPATTLGPVDHVAVVVRSVDASLPRYRDLFGLEPMGPPADFPGQHVRIAFLRTGPPPAAKIELIEPLDAESGVARFLAQRGEGLHHVCLVSADLPRDLQAFVHPRTLNGVLWELLAPESRR